MQKTIAVIGAGFAGMSAAALLAKQGFTVTLLEKNPGPGGRAAYVYYRALLIRIAQTPSSQLVQSRIRINNAFKLLLLLYAGLKIKWEGLK